LAALLGGHFFTLKPNVIAILFVEMGVFWGEVITQSNWASQIYTHARALFLSGLRWTCNTELPYSNAGEISFLLKDLRKTSSVGKTLGI
jgi:hypothetical protein